MPYDMIGTYMPPAAAQSALPIITGTPREAETLSLDTTMLTGVSGYQWKSDGVNIGGETGATYAVASQDLAVISCEVTHSGGTTETPGQVIMEPCPLGCINSGGHVKDDNAMHAMCRHEDATAIAVADGNWSAAATWLGGTVPGAGAVVLVPHGVSVTYDAEDVSPVRLDQVRVDGTLTFVRAADTKMLTETLIVSKSGVLDMGTAADPITGSVDITVSNRDFRTDPNNPTDIDITRDTRLLGRGVIWQGAFRAYGAVRTPYAKTEIGTPPMAGHTSVTLESAPTGWAIGDEIVIAGTSRDPVTNTQENEERTITNITGNVVSFSGGLSHDHDLQNAAVDRPDLCAVVMNLTRNIVIQSEDADSIPVHQRGHTMAVHKPSTTALGYVRFKGLGRTRKTMDRDDSDGIINADGDFQVATVADKAVVTPLAADSNVQSRYSAHFHFVGFNKATTDWMFGCTVDDNPSWGFVHHGCRADLNYNNMYDIAGAGMVSETGNELGEWVGNFALSGRNHTTGGLKGVNFLDESFWKHGYGFAMRGRAMRVNGNIASGWSVGFAFFHRHDNNPYAPKIAHHVFEDDIDLKDLNGRMGATLAPVDYPIIHFADNEAFAIHKGLEISKDIVDQDHGVNVNLKRFQCWNFTGIGAAPEYIGQYVLTDFDLIGSAIGYGTTNFPAGINVGANVYQIALVRPRTEHCWTALDIGFASGNEIYAADADYDADEPRYIVVAPEYVNNNVDFLDRTAGASAYQIHATEPAQTEPSVNDLFQAGSWDGATMTNTITYTLSDSVSAAGSLPKPADAVGIPGAHINRLPFSAITTLQEFGHFSYSGGNWTVHPFTFADRITARPARGYFGIEWTGGVAGSAGEIGTFTRSAEAPSVDPAVLTTTLETPGTLDVLALASTTGTGTLTLSSIYGHDNYYQPDHGILEINQPSAGQVRYTPDPFFTGTDKAYVFVEDGQGRATTVEIRIGVGLTAVQDVQADEWSVADSATPNALDITLSAYPDSGQRRIVSVEYTTDAGASWAKLYLNTGWILGSHMITEESDGTPLAPGAYTVAMRYVTDHDDTTTTASTGKAATVS